MYEFLAQSAAGLPNIYDIHLHKNWIWKFSLSTTIESYT